MLPGRRWTEVVFRWRPVTVAAALARLAPTIVRDGRRTARLARRVRRRYGVFAALRVLELLAYYRRYLELFASRHPRLAVMSSHSNPHGIALNLVALGSACRSPSSRTACPYRPSRGSTTTRPSSNGEASRLVYANAGCRMAQS
jgi:hypothetical protein